MQLIQTGDRFGRLTVIGLCNKKIRGRKVWYCRCNCGKEKTVVDDALKNKKGVKSCGCLLREKIRAYGRRLGDITGKKYGKLTVLGNSGKRKYNRILWKCKCSCGKEKFLFKVSLEQGQVVSCGCHKADLARKRAGAKHPNWQGGITPENTKDRNSQALIDWRKAVFARDEFTCFICQGRGGKLNAHHLESFSKNKGLRFEINNGITLCCKCHDDFHKRYGKIANTRLQFEEYANQTRHG